MITRTFVALASSVLLLAPCQAGQPSKKEKAEILRGDNLAFHCTLDSGLDPNKLDDCLRNEEKIQSRAARSNEAFVLGLYFRAGIDAQLMHETLNNPVSRATVRSFTAHIEAAQKSVGVSDEAMLKLIKMKPEAKALMEKAKAIGREAD